MELEDLTAIKWCWDNGIKIYPIIHKGKCKIEINYKESKHVSPEEYYQTNKGKEILYSQIIKYYQYYFNKRN